MSDTLFCFQTGNFEEQSCKVNGTIKEAIKQYESRGVPLKQLLSDYAAVISSPKVREAINSWQYYHNGIKGGSVVCGVSTAEALFNVSAMTLHRQKPIEVIKAIYYQNRLRNDSGLEKYFLDAFFFQMQTEKKIMVFNPSPFIIEYIEKYRKRNCYLVIDQTMADLYSNQYKESEFIPFHDVKEVQKADVMILFTQQAESEMLLKMMEIVSQSVAEIIYGIMPTRLIEKKDSVLWKKLPLEKYAFRDIVIVPKQMSNSNPSRKCLVSLISCPEDKSVNIHKMEYDTINKVVSVPVSGVVVSREDLLKSNTIKNLWDSHNETKERKSRGTYSSAQLYRYSKEIYISYSVYWGNRRFCGTAYYSAIKNTKIPDIRGKALTTRSQKGLRRSTKEGVVSALETFPYRNNIAKAIVGDITKNYLKAEIPITLKTLWFCLREDLLKIRSYDDEFLKSVFSKGGRIADIYPGSTKSTEIKQAISELVEIGEETKELRLLKMLNLIIEQAIQKEYLSENRITPLMNAAQNRVSKRQAEVRQALVKRSFESIEEMKIYEFLKSKCKENSICLAVIIRLFTGMSVREICGLKWQDFQYDQETEIYKFIVTKFIDKNGNLILHALEDNWEKYRVLPLGETVSRMVISRKKYLLTLGLDETLLMENPIIMEEEAIEHIRKGYKAEFCKPSIIARKCREVISKAEIPQHLMILPEDGTEIETDINNYGGDIFRTNFRDKALNNAGFGLDELNYYLGLKKPDSFSQHYCDYTNVYVQLMMGKKLDRWMEKYIIINEEKSKTVTSKACPNELITKGIAGGVPCVEVEVQNLKESKEKKVTIEVETEHGFSIIVSALSPGGIYQ